jgi:hypothetical protein
MNKLIDVNGVWGALKELGLPVVLTVVLVLFLIWLVKQNIDLNKEERERSQKSLDDERSRHQEFLSNTVKGFTSSIERLSDQLKIASDIQYKFIDHMTQYTQHIENSYDRLEKGNRSQWEEHVKMMEASNKTIEALGIIKNELLALRKEIAYLDKRGS